MPHCIKEQEVLQAYGAPHPTKAATCLPMVRPMY